MNRQAWRDFFITAFLLSISFVIALLSSIAAEQNQILQGAIAAALSLLLALVGALYIIPKLARNIRLEILRFAVRTTVTVEGVLFIVFLAVIGFAAWNTGNNLLYLILSALLAFLVAANLIGRMSLADLSIQLRFPDHIFAGEPATIIVTLTNHKQIVPAYSLLIEAVSEDSSGKRDKKNKRKEGSADEAEQAHNGHEIGKLAYFVLTPPRASARSRVDYTFERRGCYPIKGFRISTKFPAGFLKKWRRIDATGEILVYPKPKPLDDFYHALPILAGQIQSPVRGSGDDLYAIRRYHPSDHLRNIDWKATAKSSELMVREHTREDDRRLTIVLDTARPNRPFPKLSKPEAEVEDENRATAEEEANDHEHEVEDGFEERFERAIVMAASLANHFILERAEVELVTPDARFNTASGSGADHLYKILRSLARLRLSPAPEGQTPGEKKAAKKRSFFSRLRRSNSEKQLEDQAQTNTETDVTPAWRLLDEMPSLADERRFKVLITSAAKGTIPANVWRSAHVVFMEDL